MSFIKENWSDLIRIVAMVVALILSWLGVWKFFFAFDFIALGATVIGGFPMFREAYEAVLERRMTMELSMFLAVTATLVIGQFFTGLVITIFVMVAELLEHQTVGRGRDIIRKLVDFLPRKITVRRKDRELEIETTGLRLDDLVIITPGAKIPIDGIVIKGSSSVDQSSITGEPLPVEKSKGSEVFAGTMNQSGIIEVRPRRIGKDTTFGRIIDIIEKAEQSKAPIQKTADKLAARLVYIAFSGAIATYVFTHNIVSAISTLIVAGACGVAAGTPLAILAGIGRTAKEGIIVKGGVYLERLGKVDTIVLDKTGTLTLGVPQVVRVQSYTEAKRERVLQLAAIAEQHSEHPFGKAIVKRARENNLLLSSYTDLQYWAGQGLICRANGDTIVVGNIPLMKKNGVSLHGWHTHTGIQKKEPGNSTIYVSRNGHLVGSIDFEDVLRAEAVLAVTELRGAGCRVVLLTGDSTSAAAKAAKLLGVDEAFAQMLPDQKLNKIHELTQRGKIVAMVGDGINDAPALVAANVGIAMGGGTEVALESADMALTTDNLMKLVEAIRISRQCLRVIMFNFWGTIAVDTVGMALAFFGFLNPLLAASIHVTSELAFILNSARLLRS